VLVGLLFNKISGSFPLFNPLFIKNKAYGHVANGYLNSLYVFNTYIYFLFSKCMSTKKYNRILIIDDDFTSTYLTKLALEDMQIAEQVLTADNGQEGLQLVKQYCLNEDVAKQECPDLILLDINMPVMNGFEVLDELQSIGQSNLIQAKIVVLTSSESPRDKAKMLSFGVKKFLTKPLTEDKILPLIIDT
jgi:CheY-like chemotaxis protein